MGTNYNIWWTFILDIQNTLSYSNSKYSFSIRKKIGDEIEGQTKYILCTRHKSLHRKSVEVCLKCRYRKGCKDFKQYQQPELAMELNKLMGAFHKKPLGSEALEHFKKELTDIKSLC